jgi:hypothetical protein
MDDRGRITDVDDVAVDCGRTGDPERDLEIRFRNGGAGFVGPARLAGGEIDRVQVAIIGANIGDAVRDHWRGADRPADLDLPQWEQVGDIVR